MLCLTVMKILIVLSFKIAFRPSYNSHSHPFLPHTQDLVLYPLSTYSVHTFVGSDKHAMKLGTYLRFLLLDLGKGARRRTRK
jgi:hypothetical protein